MEDSWKWRLSTDNQFNTKQAYEIVRSPASSTTRNSVLNLSLRRIWSKIAPLKTSAMAWRLLQDRLPTRVNLRNSNILSQNCSTSCPLCNLCPETASHLFLDCSVSSKVWYACYNWMGISGAGHNQISQHFFSHSGIFSGKKDTILAISLWICVVWTIWKGRNKLIFDGKCFEPDKVLEEIKGRYWSWCTVKYPSFYNFTFSAWLENPWIILES